MSTRPLSDYEYFDMLSRHEDITRKVELHETMFGYGGYRKWDQVLYAKGQDESGEPLPIPPRGLAFHDSVYGDVIIFPDANGVLRVVVTDNQGLIAEIQKPTFESDPDYWELFASIARRYGEVGAGLLGGSSNVLIAAAIIGAVFLVGRVR